MDNSQLQQQHVFWLLVYLLVIIVKNVSVLLVIIIVFVIIIIVLLFFGFVVIFGFFSRSRLVNSSPSNNSFSSSNACFLTTSVPDPVVSWDTHVDFPLSMGLRPRHHRNHRSRYHHHRLVYTSSWHEDRPGPSTEQIQFHTWYDKNKSNKKNCKRHKGSLNIYNKVIQTYNKFVSNLKSEYSIYFMPIRISSKLKTKWKVSKQTTNDTIIGVSSKQMENVMKMSSFEYICWHDILWEKSSQYETINIP